MWYCIFRVYFAHEQLSRDDYELSEVPKSIASNISRRIRSEIIGLCLDSLRSPAHFQSIQYEIREEETTVGGKIITQSEGSNIQVAFRRQPQAHI